MKLRSLAIFFFVLTTLVFARELKCTTVTFRATDSVGAERLSKVLVVVRSLDGKGETARGLTTDDGLFSVTIIAPGLYQAIFLYPYGYWQSGVREFVVTNRDVLVELRLKGSVIDQIETPEKQVTVRVVDKDGNAVHGAQILGRDLVAKYMKFSTTDAQGRATVTVPCGDSQIVVIYKDVVMVKDVKTIVTTDKATESTKCSMAETLSNAEEVEITLRVPPNP